MSNLAHPVAACEASLASYLKAQVAALTIKTEWPKANEKLVMPALTITSGTPKITNCNVEQISATAPDVNHQVVVTEIVGRYDMKMQLDLWCASKLDRDTYLGAILDAINLTTTTAQGETSPIGLSLQLANYFNDWVRFDLDTWQYVDDMASAQRQERRVKLDLLVNCRAIRQRTLYAMVNLEENVGAVGIEVSLPDDLTQTEVFEI